MEKKEIKEINQSCFDIFNAVPVIIGITDFKGNILEINKYFLDYLGYSYEELKNINAKSFYVEGDNRDTIIKTLQNGGNVKNFETCIKKKDGTIKTVLINMENIQYQGKEAILSVINDFTREKDTFELLKNHEAELEEKTKIIAERIKELNCLIDISRIVEKSGANLENMLQQIVKRLPSAWQYPEITCAQIILGVQKFKTNNFKSTMWKQISHIYINNIQVGLVEICYLEKKPKILEGPFSLEERHLINAISEQLGRIIERIRNKEELVNAKNKAETATKNKSNFLANMSYEIRTPLSAILGFTELLLKDENDKNKKYKLQLIKKSSDILKELVDDILDLSRIEANKTIIEKATFSLKDMFSTIHDIILPKVKEKDLFLKYKEDRNSPQYVKGDSQKITQVLFNILANSIKFTDKGGLTLNYYYKDGNLEIKISDTGIGISKEEQKIIFSPFEQAGNILNYNYESSGLGLTISKRLIELMNGNIELESKLGYGSNFTIFIPLPEVSNSEIKHNILEYTKNDGYISEMMVRNWFNKKKGDTAYKNTLIEAIKLLPKEVDYLNNAFLNNELKKIESISHGIKGFTGMLCMTEIFNPIVRINKEANKKTINMDIIKQLLEKIKRIVKNIPDKYFIAEESMLMEKVINSASFNILVVDDNEIIQKLIKNYIVELNLSCDIATNGFAALELLKKNIYNLVLLDIQMPKMNGLEVIKHIREKEALKSIYIIVMTGMIKKRMQEFLTAGCDDYLFKPFTEEQLKEKIYKYIIKRNNIGLLK